MNILYTILALATMALAVFAVIAMIKHRFTMARLRRDARVSNKGGSMTAPEFEALEAYYRKPLPDDLRWLYEQPELVGRQSLEVRSTSEPSETYLIDRFLPATVRSVTSTWFDVGQDRFPFAIDEAGNYYVVKVGDRRDSEVLYVDHEQNSSWSIASSLSDLVKSGQSAQSKSKS